ncbi:MAG TPA: hypothetical protein VJ941_01090 [Gracilimonas sp.]|nr:hypothetical protein [Gracilimonas sp.]
MLIRLITVISLILFLLLMLSGAEVDVAIYRSMVAFMSLFSVIYLTIFLLNVVKDNNSDKMTMSGSGGGSSKNQGDS